MLPFFRFVCAVSVLKLVLCDADPEKRVCLYGCRLRVIGERGGAAFVFCVADGS